MKHQSVLKDEAIDALAIKSDGIYIDATLGRGGHALEIVKRLETGHLYCFDLDIQAIEESKEKLKDHLSKVTFIHQNFKTMSDVVKGPVDGILMDLGVSSPQFDEGDRGFSYRYDAPLDMRMNQQQSLSALDVVNTYSEEDLSRILWEYGEERYSRQIARRIIESRPIQTTFELVDIIKTALPARELRKKGHPAKQTFQALRIEVNQELSSLEAVLGFAPNMLKEGGKLCIITFHSLEDRLVKESFNKLSRPPKTDRRLPQLEREPIQFTHQLIKVSPSELKKNIRASSAKMRVLTRKETHHG